MSVVSSGRGVLTHLGGDIPLQPRHAGQGAGSHGSRDRDRLVDARTADVPTRYAVTPGQAEPADEHSQPVERAALHSSQRLRQNLAGLMGVTGPFQQPGLVEGESRNGRCVEPLCSSAHLGAGRFGGLAQPAGRLEGLDLQRRQQ